MGMNMIKVVLPRTMMVSKIEGENTIEGLYVGCPVEEFINRHCTDNIVIYLDDIEEDEHEKAAD